MVTSQRALADTSVFVGLEAARFDAGRFAGYEWGVSAVTLGELRLGVLQAKDPRLFPGGYRRISSRSGSMRSPWMRQCLRHGHCWCPGSGRQGAGRR